jgi:hypothetical protein
MRVSRWEGESGCTAYPYMIEGSGSQTPPRPGVAGRLGAAGIGDGKRELQGLILCLRVVNRPVRCEVSLQALRDGPRTPQTFLTAVPSRQTRRGTSTPTAMPSITDHIDRLTTTMKSVKASASTITQRHHPRLFTRSVLTTPLGDLIRDIDPSELGLFTLVPPPQQQSRVDAQSRPPPEITRVEVVSATPLRKHPSAQRRNVLVQPKEPEPEVFAEAALKYIDR